MIKLTTDQTVNVSFYNYCDKGFPVWCLQISDHIIKTSKNKELLVKQMNHLTKERNKLDQTYKNKR